MLGGFASLAIAILHIATIIGGPDWYRFFGAGEELAIMVEQGSWIPALLTSGIIVVFFIWGLYAFSGAGKMKRLPFLKQILIIISAAYIVRGFGLVSLIYNYAEHSSSFLMWTSLISLGIGISYAVGTKQNWSIISRK